MAVSDSEVRLYSDRAPIRISLLVSQIARISSSHTIEIHRLCG